MELGGKEKTKKKKDGVRRKKNPKKTKNERKFFLIDSFFVRLFPVF